MTTNVAATAAAAASTTASPGRRNSTFDRQHAVVGLRRRRDPER